MCFRPVTALVAATMLLWTGCGSDEESGEAGEGTTSVSESTTTAATSTTEATTSTTQATSTTEMTTSSVEDTTGLPMERCQGAESPPNIVAVISYGADCGAVEAAMAELKSVSKEFRIGDFDCARISGAALGGTWECRGEASYFTFEFGD